MFSFPWWIPTNFTLRTWAIRSGWLSSWGAFLTQLLAQLGFLGLDLFRSRFFFIATWDAPRRQIVAARAAALRLNSITKVAKAEAKTAQSVESPVIFQVTSYQSGKGFVFHAPALPCNVWLFLYIFDIHFVGFPFRYDFDLIYMLALRRPLTDLSMGGLKFPKLARLRWLPMVLHCYVARKPYQSTSKTCTSGG